MSQFDAAFPQGLKPLYFPAFFGPAKVTPATKTCRWGPRQAVPLLQNLFLKHAPETSWHDYPVQPYLIYHDRQPLMAAYYLICRGQNTGRADPFIEETQREETQKCCAEIF